MMIGTVNKKDGSTAVAVCVFFLTCHASSPSWSHSSEMARQTNVNQNFSNFDAFFSIKLVRPIRMSQNDVITSVRKETLLAAFVTPPNQPCSAKRKKTPPCTFARRGSERTPSSRCVCCNRTSTTTILCCFASIGCRCKRYLIVAIHHAFFGTRAPNAFLHPQGSKQQ